MREPKGAGAGAGAGAVPQKEIWRAGVLSGTRADPDPPWRYLPYPLLAAHPPLRFHSLSVPPQHQP